MGKWGKTISQVGRKLITQDHSHDNVRDEGVTLTETPEIYNTCIRVKVPRVLWSVIEASNIYEQYRGAPAAHTVQYIKEIYHTVYFILIKPARWHSAVRSPKLHFPKYKFKLYPDSCERFQGRLFFFFVLFGA